MRSHVTPLSSATRPLPEYAKPPVVEVACSVQFEPIDELHAGRLALLWEEYRERYPRVEQQPPLLPIREQFAETATRGGLKMLETFPMPRLWFLSEDGQRLVQVQRDHFVVNWRKLDDAGAVYPRYPALRERLSEELDTFQTFLQEEGLPQLKVLQTELTYVNHIDARNEHGTRLPLSRILKIWSGDRGLNKVPTFEEASIQAHYLIRDGSKPVGRLHIIAEPQRFLKDNAPLYALTLVARGAPPTTDMEGAFAFLDRSHEVIVEGFTAITTDEMHKLWEKR